MMKFKITYMFHSRYKNNECNSYLQKKGKIYFINNKSCELTKFELKKIH